MEEKNKSLSSSSSQSSQENKQITSTGQQNTLPPVLWIKTKSSLQTHISEVKSVTSHEAPPTLPKESKSLRTGDILSTEIKAAPYHDAILALPEEAKHMDCRDPFQPRLFPQAEADAAESLPINLNQPINSTFALGQIHQQLQRKVYVTQQSDIAISASASPTDIHRLRLLNELAANIIEQFSQRRTKTPALLQEIAALGSFANETTVHLLLGAFLDAFEDQSTLSLDLMSALAQFLRQVDLAAFEMSKTPVELPDAEAPASRGERLKATVVSGISSFLQDQASDSSWAEQAQDKGFELADRATQAIIKKNKEAKSSGPALVESKATVRRTGHSNVNLVMQLLKVVLARYGEFITQKETEYEEIQVLHILGKLFDAARGLGIEEFDEETLRDQAYKQLIERANATEEVSPELSLYANYAVQALLRLPQNNSLWKDIFQRGGKIIQAVGQLKEFWNKWDINELEGAYRNIREAFHIKHQAEPWYEALQYCQLAIRAGCFQALEEYLYHTNEQGIPYCMQRYAPAFQLGLMAILDEVLQDSHQPKTIHKACLALLKEMFLNEENWCYASDVNISRSQVWLKKAKETFLYIGIAHQASYAAAQVLNQLVRYLKHPDLHDEAQAVLRDIFDKASSHRQRQYLKSSLPRDFEQITADPLVKVEPSDELLQNAKRVAERNLSWKLESLREQVLNDKTISDKLSTYIPLATHLREKPDDRRDLLTETCQLLGLSAAPAVPQSPRQALAALTQEAGSSRTTVRTDIQPEEEKAGNAEMAVRDEKHTFSLVSEPPSLSPLPKKEQKYEVDDQGRRVLDGNNREEHKAPFVEASPSPVLRQEAKREMLKEEANTRVLLLLGNAGSGKSTYSLSLECHLWTEYHGKDVTIIPLLISLPNVKRLDGQVVEHHLRDSGFTQEHIAQLKDPNARYRLVLIFDGYDETHAKVNLYQRNALHQWPGAKVIITCRPDYLAPEHLRLYFAPTDGDGRRLSEQLAERWVASFDDKQVKGFLQQYVPYAITQAKQKNEPWKGWEQWKECYDQLNTPGLKELAATPLTLQMLVDVLPEIVRQQSDHLGQSSVGRVRRLDAYETFIRLKFEREANNSKADLGAVREVQGPKVYHFQVGEPIEADYERFCKDLAVYMFRHRRLALVYQHYWQLSYKGEELQSNELDQFFSNRDPIVKLIRRGCPLECQGTRYSFSHKSFFDYFLAQCIFQELMLSRAPISWEPLAERKATSQTFTRFSPLARITNWAHKARQSIIDRQTAQNVRVKVDDKRPLKTLLLNKWLLTDEPSILQFLAEKADSDETFRKTLLYWVRWSRTNFDIDVASANAITILNLARMPFSGLDLRGIRIPRAQLTQAILDHTKLMGADLQEVNFDGAFLRKTDFSNSKMRQAYFGQDRVRRLPGECLGIHSLSNCIFFSGRVNKELMIYDAAAGVWLKPIFFKEVNAIKWLVNNSNWVFLRLYMDGGRSEVLRLKPMAQSLEQLTKVDLSGKSEINRVTVLASNDSLVFLHYKYSNRIEVCDFNQSPPVLLTSIELPQNVGSNSIVVTNTGYCVYVNKQLKGGEGELFLGLPNELRTHSLAKDMGWLRQVDATQRGDLVFLYDAILGDKLLVVKDALSLFPEFLPTIKFSDKNFNRVVVTKDNSLIFLYCWDGSREVHIYNFAQKRMMPSLSFGEKVFGVLASDVDTFCVLFGEFSCYVYNYEKKFLFKLCEVQEKINQIVLLNSGDLCVWTAGGVYYCREWKKAPKKDLFLEFNTWNGHTTEINQLVRVNSTTFISVGSSEACLWKIRGGAGSFRKREMSLIRAFFSDSRLGKMSKVTTDGKWLFLYEDRNNQLLAFDIINEKVVSAVTLSEKILNWEITSDGRLMFLYSANSGLVQLVSFSPSSASLPQLQVAQTPLYRQAGGRSRFDFVEIIIVNDRQIILVDGQEALEFDLSGFWSTPFLEQGKEFQSLHLKGKGISPISASNGHYFKISKNKLGIQVQIFGFGVGSPIIIEPDFLGIQEVDRVTIANNGRWAFLYGEKSNTVYIFGSTQLSKPFRKIVGSQLEGVGNVIVSQDNQLLFLESYESNRVLVFDIVYEKYLRGFDLPKGEQLHEAFVFSNHQVLLRCKNIIAVFDIKKNKLTPLFDKDKSVNKLLKLPHNIFLLYGSSGCFLWIAKTSEARVLLKDIGITSAILMADGKQLITGGIDGTCRLWDISDPCTPILISCTGRMNFYPEGAIFSSVIDIDPDDRRMLQAGGAVLEDEPRQTPTDLQQVLGVDSLLGSKDSMRQEPAEQKISRGRTQKIVRSSSLPTSPKGLAPLAGGCLDNKDDNGIGIPRVSRSPVGFFSFDISVHSFPSRSVGLKPAVTQSSTVNGATNGTLVPLAEEGDFELSASSFLVSNSK